MQTETGEFIKEIGPNSNLVEWCSTHDLPFRTIRTGEDRIVCWFVWWIEAMDRSLNIEDRYDTNHLEPCFHSSRLVVVP